METMSIIYEPKGKAKEYSDLSANLYSGCAHGCTYCYAPAALRKKREDFNCNVSMRKNVLNLLEKDLIKNDYSGMNVLMSFTTDPYQPCEEKLKLTRRAIRIFNSYGCNFTILTKGGTRARRDFELYKKGDVFATTLTFDNEQDSTAWEPLAATPLNRIEAIIDAKKAGIETWVSMEPVINATQTLNLIDLTHEHVDLYKIGKANYISGIDIDWHVFVNDAIKKLTLLNKKYYIKADLAKFI